jgi:3-oxocholest-4-en-26-oate---CoA ligase
MTEITHRPECTEERVVEAATNFNLSTLFDAIARAIPDQTFLIWRDKRLTYRDVNSRVDGIAHYLHSQGLGCRIERAQLAGHESGQDHLALYLRNGNEYLEAMLGSYRARVAPFNCSFRYVESELRYLLNDSRAAALVYNAEFAPRVAAVRESLPALQHLIQVEDRSGNELLPGAVAYESIVDTAPPAVPMPVPTGDDLYILYTGGTTGMPKGVLWRQHDIFVSSMGGRPHSSTVPFVSYHDIVEQAHSAAGSMSFLLLPPLMHGAAQWMAFHAITLGGILAIPDRVDRLQPAEVLRLAEREGVRAIPVIGDAIARPLVAEIQAGDYDLSRVLLVTNGGVALSPAVRDALKAVLPHAALMDAVGASESGTQMSVVISADDNGKVSVFTPQPDTAVLADDLSMVLTGGAGGEGWLARRDYIPLGYLGDGAKTEKAFPTVDGVRWSVPGDRARALPDGRIELLGRDAATINSGGEKIFAEEVERAVACHPAVRDVIVVGRPSERWGHEVVAVVQLADGAEPTDADLRSACAQHLAGYKIPKSFVRTPTIMRSPAGKADYRWAKQVAAANPVNASTTL